ncbi:hypothetical protein OAG34_01960 [bacterium]|nr:hypothetical protein [bacterium]
MGKRLCDAWKELDSTSLGELLQERNKGTHHTVNNDEKTQKVLVKYSELIEKFTPALENIDWPKIDVSDEKITRNDELRGALFISRGTKYDCGPLLMFEASYSEKEKNLFLSHTLDGATILQNKSTGQKGHACGYRAHRPSDPSVEAMKIHFEF